MSRDKSVARISRSEHAEVQRLRKGLAKESSVSRRRGRGTSLGRTFASCTLTTRYSASTSCSMPATASWLMWATATTTSPARSERRATGSRSGWLTSVLPTWTPGSAGTVALGRRDAPRGVVLPALLPEVLAAVHRQPPHDVPLVGVPFVKEIDDRRQSLVRRLLHLDADLHLLPIEIGVRAGELLLEPLDETGSLFRVDDVHLDDDHASPPRTLSVCEREALRAFQGPARLPRRRAGSLGATTLAPRGLGRFYSRPTDFGRWAATGCSNRGYP